MILNLLRRHGLRRGVLGGSRAWFTVWAAVALVRVVRRFTKNESRVVFSEELHPGETLLITAVPRVKGSE